MPGKDGDSGLWEEKEAQRMEAAPEKRRGGDWGWYGKLKRSMSITQAWAVAKWEVVMDQSRLPLSRKRPQRGQA
ncbi:hypothetical protein CesoFtcFv8_005042 [Champsocephalus esox]|uniref:Uncharacterized protein n=1 Tax=Champsocephalus esox TaxID=159716 RepID=A0AAN8H993_9TELE|nr:hypothetical protein CesoFtcFv8_005042 [Champsocephalus esox]